MKLITGKMEVPEETPRIFRPRLFDALQGSLESGNATIINGRAGTGKTMLSVDFARRCGWRVAWYKVDSSDADPSVFWEYMVASVARKHPGFGDNALADGRRSAFAFDISELVEAYAHILERQSGSLLLVLDDLHLIYDAEWVAPFFQRLLPLLPPEAHLLILGRGLPPAPLWRLRSKQRLLVINEPMLAFTQQEAEELFFSYGLDAQQANLALKQTGGRAASLHAAAIRALATSADEGGRLTASEEAGAGQFSSERD